MKQEFLNLSKSLEELGKSTQALTKFLKGGPGSGPRPGGGSGNETDETTTGKTTRTLDRIRTNTEKAFPNASDFTNTSSGVAVTLNGSLGDVEDGLSKMGFEFDSNGSYSTPMDSAGVKIKATVNTPSGNNKQGQHIISIERSGSFVG